MDRATASGFTQKQYLMMTGFVIVVVVGAFAYFNGFLGGGTRDVSLAPSVDTTSP
jgi:hypothetical protein